MLLVCLVANAATRQLYTIPRAIAHQGSVRSDALVARDEAYEWIRSNTNRDDRFIAWEDAKLYLETNRAAIRAVSARTSYFYNQDMSILNGDLDRPHETAEGIGASHWLVTPDDYSLCAGKKLCATDKPSLTVHPGAVRVVRRKHSKFMTQPPFLESRITRIKRTDNFRK